MSTCMGPEYCDDCNDELEEGQIGLCDDCQQRWQRADEEEMERRHEDDEV